MCIFMNEKMRRRMEAINLKDTDTRKYPGLDKIKDPHIVTVNDCFILDIDHSLMVDEINWGKVLAFFGDYTGYESSCNEIRIDDFLPCDLDSDRLLQISLQVMDRWVETLKLSYPENSFIVILSCDLDHATLRFHKWREGEGVWMNEDLEQFEEAVCIRKINL